MSDTAAKRELDPTLPAYKAIRKYVLKLVTGPDFGPGDRIPSERVLAELLGRNRMTVRKALDGLVADGVLERDSTSGTRVASARVKRPIDARNSLGISRIVSGSGGVPGNKLLHFEQTQASSVVAERLQIPEGADVWKFRRLWTVNGRPFCIETSHLPLDLVPDLSAEDLVASQPLYELLRQRYGLGVVNGEREIGVARVTGVEARLLGLEENERGLLLRLQVYEESGRPIEYMRSMNHPDLVAFRT